MPDPVPPRGLRAYVAQLLRTIVFPLLWLQGLRFARQHRDTDPRAAAKVGVAIAIGVVLAAGLGAFLHDQYVDMRAGMYDSLEGRLAEAVGETGRGSFQAQVDGLRDPVVAMRGMARTLNSTAAEGGDPGQAEEVARLHALHQAALDDIHPITDDGLMRQLRNGRDIAGVLEEIRERLEELRGIGQEMNATVLQIDAAVALETGWQHGNLTAEALGALDGVQGRAENHVLFLDLRDALAEERARVPVLDPVDDARVLAMVEGRGLDFPADMVERAEAAFAHKNASLGAMDGVYVFLLLPSLVGVFLAPMVFAMGSVLRQAWVPSETVGYRPYPSKAMGWFLLLGGFGVPALFFAAWSFQDMEIRRVEGQIAL